MHSRTHVVFSSTLTSSRFSIARREGDPLSIIDLRFTASDYAEVVNPHSKPVRLPLSIPIETVSALGTNISSSPTTSTPPHLPEGSLRFLKDYSTREISVLDRHNKDSERRTSGRYTLNSHHPSKATAKAQRYTRILHHHACKVHRPYTIRRDRLFSSIITRSGFKARPITALSAPLFAQIASEDLFDNGMSSPSTSAWVKGSDPQKAKRRRSSSEVKSPRPDVPRPPPSLPNSPPRLSRPNMASPSLHSSPPSSEGSDSDGVSTAGVGENDSRQNAAMSGSSSDDWYYSLEVIQQPQRARACGFGDKDRRPLSPPPIIRLWVRTSTGEVVDPSHVSIQFLVLMVDLWSSDGTQKRHVVMHPGSSTARTGIPEYPEDTIGGFRPDTATSRPNTGQSSAFGSGWQFTAAPPDPSSPSTSPLTRLPHMEATLPPPLLAPSWPQPERPLVHRAQSYSSSNADIEVTPARPFTAPSRHTNVQNPASTFNLPSLSVVASHPQMPRRTSLTLPALREIPSSMEASGSSAESQHRVSWSFMSNRPFHSDPPTRGSRPGTGSSWTDRPRTSGGLSRPSTAGDPSMSRYDPRYASSESSYGFPLTPEAAAVTFPTSAPSYSRVLVGSLTATCRRLKDAEGVPGMFFFAHDLGVRTEGVFTLKFTLVNIASLMTASTRTGDGANVLAEVFSEPFTVYSAKRFPGVIHTTELTRLFVNQGVRLPTRQRRAPDAADNSGEEE